MFVMCLQMLTWVVMGSGGSNLIFQESPEFLVCEGLIVPSMGGVIF